MLRRTSGSLYILAAYDGDFLIKTIKNDDDELPDYPQRNSQTRPYFNLSKLYVWRWLED